MKNPIPKRITQAREEKGLSQRQLGIKAGIDPFAASPRINQYERGKHTPDYSTVSRLAKVLDVPVPYFYAAEDDVADIIVKFYRLKPKNKKQLLKQLQTFDEN